MAAGDDARVKKALESNLESILSLPRLNCCRMTMMFVSAGCSTTDRREPASRGGDVRSPTRNGCICCRRLGRSCDSDDDARRLKICNFANVEILQINLV